jgi:hypothetical protein
MILAALVGSAPECDAGRKFAGFDFRVGNGKSGGILHSAEKF